MSAKKICLCAMFLALGIVLPFVTMNVPVVGKALLPMHIPVLLGGFVLGPAYGLLLGVLTPLVRSVLFNSPTMFPSAISMVFELGAYGFFSGLIYWGLFKRNNNLVCIYTSLIFAMLLGRVIYGIFKIVLSFIQMNEYTLALFISGAFLNAIPGIILQLVLIPILVKVINKSKIRV